MQHFVRHGVDVPPALDRVRLKHLVNFGQVLLGELHISSREVFKRAFCISVMFISSVASTGSKDARGTGKGHNVWPTRGDPRNTQLRRSYSFA